MLAAELVTWAADKFMPYCTDDGLVANREEIMATCLKLSCTAQMICGWPVVSPQPDGFHLSQSSQMINEQLGWFKLRQSDVSLCKISHKHPMISYDSADITAELVGRLAAQAKIAPVANVER